MRESSKHGGGVAAHPQNGLGRGLPFQRSMETGLRVGRVELSMERSLDALSVSAIRVDGLRGIKLA